MDMPELLKAAVATGCSDIHLCVGRPPMIRLHGIIQPLAPSLSPLDAEEVRRLIYSSLTEVQRKRIEQDLDLDCSFTLAKVARFRLNVMNTHLGTEAAIRVVSSAVPEPEALTLTPAMV